MRTWGLGAVVLIGTAWATGCGPRAGAGGFESDNPAARLYAIQQAAAARDRAAVPQLVEELDSDDPAVRVWAIHALESITGERLGYNPYASPEARRPAIEAWTEAVRQQRFHP